MIRRLWAQLRVVGVGRVEGRPHQAFLHVALGATADSAADALGGGDVKLATERLDNAIAVTKASRVPEVKTCAMSLRRSQTTLLPVRLTGGVGWPKKESTSLSGPSSTPVFCCRTSAAPTSRFWL